MNSGKLRERHVPLGARLPLFIPTFISDAILSLAVWLGV